MQRGPLYKKTPFKMKGYSYPGKSPVRQTNYFKTDLFTDPYNTYKMTDEELMAPYLKNRQDAQDQGKYLSPDGTYDYASDPKYKDRFKSTNIKEEEEEETKTKKGKKRKGGGMDPELLLAATMPIGYMIGKGLTSLFGGRSKKERIAKAGEEQEKKVNLKVNKELMAKGRRAQYMDPKTGKVMTSKQMGEEWERRKKPLGKDYKLGDLSGGLKLK